MFNNTIDIIVCLFKHIHAVESSLDSQLVNGFFVHLPSFFTHLDDNLVKLLYYTFISINYIVMYVCADFSGCKARIRLPILQLPQWQLLF